MFGGIKSLFGGSNAQSMAQMLGPMLPGMLKEAKPALLQAFKDKALELENETDYELTEDDEICPFVVIRDGELRVQWVIITHQDDDVIVVQDVLEIVTLEDLFRAVTQQAPQPKGLPPHKWPSLTEPEAQQPQTMLQKAGVDTERHNKYFNQRYVVIKIGNTYEVIEGPADEGDTVYYGHQDETICQNWADKENRKLNV